MFVLWASYLYTIFRKSSRGILREYFAVSAKGLRKCSERAGSCFLTGAEPIGTGEYDQGVRGTVMGQPTAHQQAPPPGAARPGVGMDKPGQERGAEERDQAMAVQAAVVMKGPKGMWSRRVRRRRASNSADAAPAKRKAPTPAAAAVSQRL